MLSILPRAAEYPGSRATRRRVQLPGLPPDRSVDVFLHLDVNWVPRHGRRTGEKQTAEVEQPSHTRGSRKTAVLVLLLFLFRVSAAIPWKIPRHGDARCTYRDPTHMRSCANTLKTCDNRQLHLAILWAGHHPASPWNTFSPLPPPRFVLGYRYSFYRRNTLYAQRTLYIHTPHHSVVVSGRNI